VALAHSKETRNAFALFLFATAGARISADLGSSVFKATIFLGTIPQIRKDLSMKRTILSLAIGVMFGVATFTVEAQQTPPVGAPAAPPAQGAGRGGPGAARGVGGGPARGGQQQVGPPAPVPPQVAIPRPTPQELTQINDAFKKFVETDTSAAKPLLQQYQSLLTVQPRVNTAATFTEAGPRVGARHAAFVELSKAGGIDLLLQGDSITDGWDSAANKPVMDKYFGKYKTANFGVSGDTTQGVLWGMRNGEAGFQPKAIMLMIGTNNTGRNTAPEIAEGIGAVVMEMRRNFPDARILLLGVFPRTAAGNAPIRQTIAEINRIISKLDDQKNVFYMDIGAKFLDASGNLPADVMPDALHPNAKGYEIWGEAVKDKIAELMK
jgi:beta-glucosidase